MNWGRPVPETVKPNVLVSWGARAIYTNQLIDLLPDRQGFGIVPADNEQAIKKLAQWVNKVGLPQLRKQTKTLYTDENRTISFDSDVFHIEANPQSSYGYLYIVAWMLKPSSERAE